MINIVATAPTVYGIETYRLMTFVQRPTQLQQHLPFTVLKRLMSIPQMSMLRTVATAPTVYGIETHHMLI